MSYAKTGHSSIVIINYQRNRCVIRCSTEKEEKNVPELRNVVFQLDTIKRIVSNGRIIK